MKILRSFAVAGGALALVAGCASTGEQAHFPPEQGWSLCRTPMPVETVGFAPGSPNTEIPVGDQARNERTNVAGAVALAFALHCDASTAVAQQAQGYRGITAIRKPEANRVRVYPGSGELVVDVPPRADYRSDAFLAELRTGITCGLAPNEIADASACGAD